MVANVLDELGFESLKPMQEEVLNSCHGDNNVVLLSPTGSGKTLAFLLPILKFLERDKDGVQAMVIAPSRELVLQIEQVFRHMKTGFKVNSCYGGHPMKTERNNLLHPPALLIGTPGRLADHLRRETFDPSGIRTLVLDEFDKALELGFQREMKAIIEELTGLRMRILTSATDAIKIPSFTGFRDELTINYLKETKLPTLQMFTVRAEGHDKLDALIRLLCALKDGAKLVFCNHREAVERISDLLKSAGIDHGTFHGGLQQEDRERALLKFRNGSHQTLITTDLASRGLDIPEIRHVIHYQLPPQEAAFIHRNGRTARMHADGSSYLVLAEEEHPPSYFKDNAQHFELPEDTIIPPRSKWATVYIGAGKKDKISKGDVVGFLIQQGKLGKDDLGLIELQDRAAYVAVPRKKIDQLVAKVRHERIKKKKVKIAISK